MGLLLQQILDGLSSGAVYGAVGLALVLVYRSTRIVNFAQGEMAMFGTFFAWQLWTWGLPIWVATVVAVAASFVGGVLIDRLLIRPVQDAPLLSLVIVTLGVYLLVHAIAPLIWGFDPHRMPFLFGSGTIDLGSLSIAEQDVGALLIIIALALALRAFFTHTRLGLALTASAENPDSSSLVGINVPRMLMLGWGLAAALGTFSGVLIAPKLVLDPDLMSGVLLYAFASATLGGFDSPGGAVIGGLVVGVTENLAGTYLGFVGNELKVCVPLLIIFVVLSVRPAGLFGSQRVIRV